MSTLRPSFEDLPNEIFAELFDYLSSHHIFTSFFDLNRRFRLFCLHYRHIHIDTRDATLTNRALTRLLQVIPPAHISSLTLCNSRELPRIQANRFTALRAFTADNVTNPAFIDILLNQLPSPDHLRHLSLSFNWCQCQADLQLLVATISIFSSLNRLELHSNYRKLDFRLIDRPLLSLRHLSVSCRLGNDLFHGFPRMPNLISLHFAYEYYECEFYVTTIMPNSLPKLRQLRVDNVRDYYVLN